MDTETVDKKAKWANRVEVVVALVGYSVGMSEIWRVPFLTYRNGGGAFIIAYTIMMMICGLPLYLLEISLSQFSGKGPWAFWDICPLFRGVGIAVAVINFISAVKTIMLQTWAFEYFTNSFKYTLPWTSCDNEWNTNACYAEDSNILDVNSTLGYSISNSMNIIVAIYKCNIRKPAKILWHTEIRYKILRVSDGIEDIGTISGIFVVYMLVMRTLAGLSIIKSIKTLGKVLYVTALLPVILITIIWIRALTLPGSLKGIKLFISTDLSRFVGSQLWTEAAFQTFITLGPGWGGLMMMGCHNKFNTSCLRAAVISTTSTLVFGLFNGLVVFSVVGVMSEEINIPISQVLTSGGFSIGFIAYPKALSYFPAPQLWCVIFYFALLLPGLDTMSILTEPFLLVLEEMFPKFLRNRRTYLLLVVSIIMFLFGLPLATQAGVYIFLLADWYTATWSVMLICLGECIVLCWVYGMHRVDRDVRLMIGRPLPGFIRISASFVMPVFLLCLLLISIYSYKPPSFGDYTYPTYARAIGWCFTLSSILPAMVYGIWLVKSSDGSLKKRLKGLIRHGHKWQPADDEALILYNNSEITAEFSWKEICWYNLTGKRNILDGCRSSKENGEDINLTTVN